MKYSCRVKINHRADGAAGESPAAEGIDESTQLHTRSVTSPPRQLGMIAKIDLLESDGGCAVPGRD